MAQFNGKVAWFNKAKGFGLLAREDGPDIFLSLQRDSDGRIQGAE